MLWRKGDLDHVGDAVVDVASTWLCEHSQVGDVVLVGSGDIISRWIQRVTKSEYNHAAIVSPGLTLTESTDHALTPSEDDDGVYEIPFADFFDRYRTLRRIALYRPDDGDTERMVWTMARIRDRAPTYPTVGAAVLGLAVWTDQAAGLLRKGRTGLYRFVDDKIRWQVRFIGDGPLRVTCSELVARVADAAESPLRFVRPLLFRHIDIVNGPGDYEADDLPDPTTNALRIPRKRIWVPPRSLWDSIVVARRSYRQGAVAWSERIRSARPGDIADFILPEDLTQADNLRRVAELIVHPDGRVVTEYGPRPGDRPSDLGASR